MREITVLFPRHNYSYNLKPNQPPPLLHFGWDCSSLLDLWFLLWPWMWNRDFLYDERSHKVLWGVWKGKSGWNPLIYPNPKCSTLFIKSSVESSLKIFSPLKTTMPIWPCKLYTNDTKSTSQSGKIIFMCNKMMKRWDLLFGRLIQNPDRNESKIKSIIR